MCKYIYSKLYYLKFLNTNLLLNRIFKNYFVTTTSIDKFSSIKRRKKQHIFAICHNVINSVTQDFDNKTLNFLYASDNADN